MAKIGLELGPVSLENITQRTISIIGGKGAGKTTLGKMIAYKMLDNKELTVIVIDTLNVMRVAGYTDVLVGKADVEGGKACAKFVNSLKHGEKCIISFNGMLQAEYAHFVNDLFMDLKVSDALIIIDEIHEYCPEVGVHGLYCPEVERAIKHWRNSNVGFVIISQRIAQVAKNVLALTDIMFCLRVTFTLDVKALRNLIETAFSKEKTEAIIRSIQLKGFLQGYVIKFV